MAYQALYRRFRPQSFAEMVGQEHVIPVLRNQVLTGRISHAYLFSGTRGTGKTSAAKLFARAINCENPHQGEACGKCAACGHSGDEVDIIEIDAASNNGVDHIRDLREKARFAPLYSKYKVYIIDEAHMLSTGAFNALLKTLEEPPAHIVFILATTESNKIPVTILSRCQRFDFHRISESVIASRLKDVLDQSGVNYENEAITAIARSADGGLRDALSVADQCLSFLGGKITLSGVLDMLGSMDSGFMETVLKAFSVNDAATLIGALDDVALQGRDILLFVRDFTLQLRAMLVILTCGSSARRILGEPESFDRIEAVAKACSAEQLLRAISILQRAEADAKWLTPSRPVLECAMIKLCRPEDEKSMLALEARVAMLESKLERGVTPSPSHSGEAELSDLPAQSGEAEPSKQAQKKKPAKQAPASTDTAANGNVNAGSVLSKLLDILKKEALSLYMLAKNAAGASIDGTSFTLNFIEPFESRVDSLSVEKNTLAVQAALDRVMPGMKIRFAKSDQAAPSPDSLLSQALELFGADVVQSFDE